MKWLVLFVCVCLCGCGVSNGGDAGVFERADGGALGGSSAVALHFAFTNSSGVARCWEVLSSSPVIPTGSAWSPGPCPGGPEMYPVVCAQASLTTTDITFANSGLADGTVVRGNLRLGISYCRTGEATRCQRLQGQFSESSCP